MGTFNKKQSFKRAVSPNARGRSKVSAPVTSIDRAPVPVGAQIFGKENPQGMGLFRLSTTVITLIVGAGVFTMSGDQAAGGASGAAIATAWAISGVGVLCLVLTFFALSRLKPHITGGIFVYARKGFGEFIGFASAWGYWWSALLTTVTFCALLFESLAYFFPIFGDGGNLWCLVGASVLAWGYAALAARGIGEISLVNAIITVSKIVPILFSIVLILLLGKFDPALFWQNFSTGANPGLPFFDQVVSALMLTMWVFVGIEGAVAVSGRAKRQSDVGKATLIAFCCVMAIYLSVSMLSMGIMPLSELAELQNPSLAYVMERVVGPWGAGFISFAVSLSLVGAMLGYTILATEAPYSAALQGIFPAEFSRTNKRGAPVVTILRHHHRGGDMPVFLGVHRRGLSVLLRYLRRYDTGALSAVGCLLCPCDVAGERAVRWAVRGTAFAMACGGGNRCGVQPVPGVRRRQQRSGSDVCAVLVGLPLYFWQRRRSIVPPCKP